MTLAFSALPFSRPTCAPTATEDRQLAPAYSAMVFNEKAHAVPARLGARPLLSFSPSGHGSISRHRTPGHPTERRAWSTSSD
jgi:hypothetical protein